MTLNEARFVVRNRSLYTDATFMMAVEILDRAGEFNP